MAEVSEHEEIADYHIDAVEDKDTAAKVTALLTSSHGHGKEWSIIGHVFLMWLGYCGKESIEEWYMEQAQIRMARAVGNLHPEESDFDGAPEDGGRPIEPPAYLLGDDASKGRRVPMAEIVREAASFLDGGLCWKMPAGPSY